MLSMWIEQVGEEKNIWGQGGCRAWKLLRWDEVRWIERTRLVYRMFFLF